MGKLHCRNRLRGSRPCPGGNSFCPGAMRSPGRASGPGPPLEESYTRMPDWMHVEPIRTPYGGGE